MPTICGNGETLDYITASNGPALVFVHYLGAYSRQWQCQVDALQGKFTCIAFNQRSDGFPVSTLVGPDKKPAQALKAGLDVLGIDKAHFVAYSMGGLEMVRSLMLIVNSAKSQKN
mgnify:CR=1 FL=1|jgi:pimeloyl-ACP methyl ester carboxylesterase